jgi:hypothetical protein
MRKGSGEMLCPCRRDFVLLEIERGEYLYGYSERRERDSVLLCFLAELEPSSGHLGHRSDCVVYQASARLIRTVPDVARLDDQVYCYRDRGRSVST